MVEVPSHLFEHWAIDHGTLQLLARHHSGTRDPLPPAAAAALVRARRTCSALDLQGQVRLFEEADGCVTHPLTCRQRPSAGRPCTRRPTLFRNKGCCCQAGVVPSTTSRCHGPLAPHLADLAEGVRATFVHCIDARCVSQPPEARVLDMTRLGSRMGVVPQIRGQSGSRQPQASTRRPVLAT